MTQATIGYTVVDMLTNRALGVWHSTSERGAKTRAAKALHTEYRYLSAFPFVETPPVAVPLKPAPLRTQAEIMYAPVSPVADWEIDYTTGEEYYSLMEHCGDETDSWVRSMGVFNTLSELLAEIAAIRAQGYFIRLEVLHWVTLVDYAPTASEAVLNRAATLLSGDYYLTNADGSHNPIGSAPLSEIDPMADELFTPETAPIDDNGWTYTALTLAPADMTCGTCGGVWNSKEVPTPAARCPFEYDHDSEDQEEIGTAWIASEPPTEAEAARARILDALIGETDRDTVDKLCRQFAYWVDQD